MFYIYHFHLILKNNTLNTVGTDFNMLSEELMFNPQNAQDTACQQVSLIDDDSSEDTEYFLIELSSTNYNVIPGSPIQVVIFDEDSEGVYYAV